MSTYCGLIGVWVNHKPKTVIFVPFFGLKYCKELYAGSRARIGRMVKELFKIMPT